MKKENKKKENLNIKQKNTSIQKGLEPSKIEAKEILDFKEQEE